MQLMPGSPFNDEKLNDDQRAALYVKYGLDQPVVVQFANYAKNMLKGDLGVSYNISKNTPISQMIQTRLPISIGIGGLAVTIGAIVGLLLGLLAALKHNIHMGFPGHGHIGYRCVGAVLRICPWS